MKARIPLIMLVLVIIGAAVLLCPSCAFNRAEICYEQCNVALTMYTAEAVPKGGRFAAMFGRVEQYTEKPVSLRDVGASANAGLNQSPVTGQGLQNTDYAGPGTGTVGRDNEVDSDGSGGDIEDGDGEGVTDGSTPPNP